MLKRPGGLGDRMKEEREGGGWVRAPVAKVGDITRIQYV